MIDMSTKQSSSCSLLMFAGIGQRARMWYITTTVTKISPPIAYFSPAVPEDVRKLWSKAVALRVLTGR